MNSGKGEGQARQEQEEDEGEHQEAEAEALPDRDRELPGPRQHVRRLLQAAGGPQGGEEDPGAQPTVRQ